MIDAYKFKIQKGGIAVVIDFYIVVTTEKCTEASFWVNDLMGINFGHEISPRQKEEIIEGFNLVRNNLDFFEEYTCIFFKEMEYALTYFQEDAIKIGVAEWICSYFKIPKLKIEPIKDGNKLKFNIHK